MKTSLFLIFSFFVIDSIVAQYLPSNNLVVNPHFTDFSSYVANHPSDIPCVDSVIYMECGYQNENTQLFHLFCLHDWVRPTLGTTWWRHIDSCSYFPYPESPFNKRASVSLDLFAEFPYQHDYRQYAQGILIDPLIHGNTYCVSMYLMLDIYTWYGTPGWGSVVYATSSVGAYLSKFPIKRSDMQPFYEYYPPQIENSLDRLLLDSLNWMLVSGTFVADGGEKYITIGNFLNNSLTPIFQFKNNNSGYVSASFYMLGFVGVYDCTGHEYQCNAGEDIRICRGEVVQLGKDEDSRRQYFWSPGKGLSDSTAARPLAAPTETTTYFLRVVDEFLQQSYDTVTVEVVECNIWVPNSFTPNRDGLNDELCVIGEGIEQLSLVIFNRRSEVVFETKDQYRCWDGTYNGRLAPQGVYVYLLRATLADGTTVNRDGVVMLIR